MPLLPGEILNKHYRIVSLLAEGPYGAVYRAWGTRDSRHYAIKEYLDPSVDIQKRFRAEARRLSSLNHPQLPAVRDHFVLEETGQYLVSDYIDGVDLQSLLNQYGPLPSDLIIGWLQAACEPLAYLHERKQCHLNIKPANIRLTPGGEVFLVDTGLPGLGIRPHTAGYGAPEQQAQIDVGPTSDIYSLGATLYTLLTGIVPPKSLSRESGLEELIPPREVNPDVEPYLSIVASRAMSLRPDVRYESVKDFARALERPIGHPPPVISDHRRTPAQQPIAAPPPRLPVRTRKQIEQRAIIGLSALLVVVFLVLLALTQINTDRPTAAAPVEATATLQSAVIAALTALAPTPSATPEPTVPPTPTPQPLITSTGSRMLFMPAGTFRMGVDEGEADEQPSHLVYLDAYYIDETEVTNGAYAQCVEAEVCRPPARPGATYHPAYYGNSQYDNYPVIFVSWHQADTFCKWRGGRLPTEAEWEKAAGFDPIQAIKLRYPWGDAFDGIRLNFCDANCTQAKRNSAFDDGHRDTAPVGSYPDGRSPIGVHDMAGNVMEWVADWYSYRAYRDSSDTNPLGPLTGDFRVLRGGSWLSAQEEVATTARSSFDPTVSRANLGFRCASDPS